MFAFILILIFPNVGTAIWGWILLVTAPPLGLIILLNAAIYGWLLSYLAKLLSIGICYFEQGWLRALLLIAVLLACLTITFVPIYGSGTPLFSNGTILVGKENLCSETLINKGV